MPANDPPPEPRKPFKDWFDDEAARRLAEQIGSVTEAFDLAKFVQLATRRLDELEFIARVRQFSAAARQTLPDPPEALDILRRSLPPVLPDCESPTDGWLQWPIGQFIADYGGGHFSPAMEAMVELTKRFSSEFAVRPFVEREPERVFAQMLKLAQDKNSHVRRWCSEGVRPRLPWGRKLHSLVADPSPIWPILEALKDDPELYVRRSVANNLNDIAKDHPQLVVARCEAWSKDSNTDRDWVIKHGLRTLIKLGHPQALAVVGFRTPRQLGVVLRTSPLEISLGESVVMRAQITNQSKATQKLMIDYCLHYVRQGGKTSAKVFKWKSSQLAAGETLELEKLHAMKKTTTRALYPGTHLIEIQVNGVRLAEAAFEFIG